MKWTSWFFSLVEAKSSDNSTSKSNESSHSENTSDTQSSKPASKIPSDEGTYYGYDYYPERRSGKGDVSFVTKVIEMGKAKQETKRLKCEMEVYRNIKENFLVKIMIGALEKAGCPVDVRRHFACEVCDTRICGGYDPELNQIVVCLNKGKGNWQAVLVHELVHMYDHCVNKVDFKNLEHLACTEIRAANLSHCSFLSSFMFLESSFFNVKKTHQYCVKRKACQSLQIARNVDFETAYAAVAKVFDKCYNDLEPFGRRIRRNSYHDKMSYDEAVYYGYCDPD